jgi:hypothetical protein
MFNARMSTQEAFHCSVRYVGFKEIQVSKPKVPEDIVGRTDGKEKRKIGDSTCSEQQLFQSLHGISGDGVERDMEGFCSACNELIMERSIRKFVELVVVSDEDNGLDKLDEPHTVLENEYHYYLYRQILSGLSTSQVN